MKRFFLILLTLMTVLPACSRKLELACFLLAPGPEFDGEAIISIYDAPDGEEIYQVESGDYYQITALAPQEGDWWRIKDGLLFSFGEEVELSEPQAWVHRSVLALGTDNNDGQYRFLRTEPRADAPKAGTILEFNATVRPLELSPDGKWVKVTYAPADLTGWMETSLTRDESFEPGDGYDFPSLMVFAIPETDVAMLSVPEKGEKTFVLQEGKTYCIHVAHGKDSWWQMISGYVTEDDAVKIIPDESWVPASALYLRIVDSGSDGDLTVYSKADEDSAPVGTLQAGMKVHPLEIGDEYGNWIRVSVIGQEGLTGWVKNQCLSWQP